MKNWLYQMGLVLILLLCGLSIVGAFLGAASAEAMFNSISLAILWISFIVLLIGSLFVFRGLQIRPMLCVIHLGCILVIIGGLWGSQAGHRLSGEGYLDKGTVKLYPGDTTDQVVRQSDSQPINPGFEIQLRDFQVLYYDTPKTFLSIQSDSKQWTVPAYPGTEYSLSAEDGKVRILAAFANLKMDIVNGKTVAKEGPAVESNPAWLLEFVAADGMVTQQFVLEKHPGRIMAGYKYFVFAQKQGMVKDFISDLVIVKDGKPIAQQQIEVNHPMSVDNVRIYQSSYGQDTQGTYSVLDIVSDRGVHCVFSGYLLVTIGLFGHFLGKVKREKEKKAD